ncbi:hypothetical protein TPHA_0D02150 [Tetrapisispora phaffii CBS 4417]|uniref:Anaphase-promoting complex subunit 4-like WD40 domain-containing protein n=1 Tax=Tetrapisispora phaffii (strain ATCC 24235 / CBS 4417 / NBRC 1672 / NRRL Y-8282 / UCD 70-5) TaxID=1071381 RepID=G8BSN2_TETPH|nr:hypothetical protein TPHA_0D02150 [Tetrapisispora phaffii CBS 4417]CCE62853.1 hypothetical protein TPHA_0D02150 [Tetrapisispora phaffii CBS 4417]
MTSQERLTIHRARFLDLATANITVLAFSHDSDVAGSEKRLDNLNNINNNKSKLTPSDLRLAVGRSNGNIEIWNPRNGWFQELVIQGGKGRSIEGLVWRNVPGEPLRLFSIGGSTVVTEWNLATGLPLKNFDGNAGVIWSIAINSSKDKLALGCDNGTIVIVNISGGQGVLEYETILMRQDARILSLTWNKDEFVIGGCSDGRIRIWSVNNNGRITHTMKVDKAKSESTLIWSVIYLPASNQIVSGDSTGSVKFWDFHYATLNQSFKTHESDVLTLTTDCTNTQVFSAGIDRKIYQYSQVKDSKNSKSGANNKWTVASNRLLHSNDIRSLCSYQAKGADFLASGGSEQSVVISSLSSFADGNYKKIPPIVPFSKNFLINREQRLVVMWYESTVKIWTIGDDVEDDKNYKLVCKLNLKDEQNISTCGISPDGTVLVVGRSSTTKVFHLQPMDSKLKVTKLDNNLLLKTGTRFVKFIDNSKLLICSVEDEVFTIDLESDDDEEMTEIELPEIQQTKSGLKLPFINNINNIDINGKYAVVSYGYGVIVLIDIETKRSRVLANLMNYVTSIIINPKRKSIISVTADNKIYEFNLTKLEDNEENNTGEDSSEEQLLSEWSKNNTDNLPKQFQELKEKCVGIFLDENSPSKVWFWTVSCLCRLDFSVDLPISNRKKTKKRSRDGLTITDESNFLNDGEDEDEDMDIDSNELPSITNDNYPRVKNDDSKRVNDEGEAFFITEKYKSILFTDFISKDEIFIVEKPQLLSSSSQKGAFNLSKLRF